MRTIINLALRFYRDETGFVVSAELALVSTVTVLALVVGLSEVAYAINTELFDIANAFGSLNQSFSSASARSIGGNQFNSGSQFNNSIDIGATQSTLQSTPPAPEM